MSDKVAIIAPVSKSTLVVAAAFGLIFSLAILYVFYRVMQSLLRLKKASQSMSAMDINQLKTMMGSDEAAQAIKDGSDNLWINLTLIGLAIAYGIGSVLGAASSVFGLYNALKA